MRTLFLSDLHLGSRAAQAGRLCAFLDACEAETIYLVGDVVDEWRLRRRWHWPDEHHGVTERLLARALSGRRVVYLPGNHDSFLRALPLPHRLGSVEVRNEAVHETADGRRLLVLHGDAFDWIVTRAPMLAHVGDRLYDLALYLGRAARRRRGDRPPRFSLAAAAAQVVRRLAGQHEGFPAALARAAREKGCDGVVCGHLHVAGIQDEDGVDYINCGDWIENATAVVERHDGRLELLRWTGAGLEHVAEAGAHRRISAPVERGEALAPAGA
ncbi:UDP-2,3-diacylglucosamine diphosphatase [Aurantimonas sp. Leaf443]|uniref:UDP-2,3-diacylglucosamine diphosphatase n=1 Tax=Aurantimonas sp. Leaf443 TaxID=1736378 RepID=UPI001FCCD87C|nr:UDP-2,3-diacylglucosamine diphosphatase [Aurantimonas sp. Leaf443]